MEGEPVARHYGTTKAQSDTPLFCVFIAPKISDGTLAHYFNLNQINTKFYGGKTQIIPMTLQTFIAFSKRGVDERFNDPQKLKSFCQNAIDLIPSVADEGVWLNEIEGLAMGWT